MSAHKLPLRHFSIAQAIFPLTETQRADDESGSYEKPKGLWVSVEGGEGVFGWSDWCNAEDWDIGGYQHAVTLAANANVLLIESADALRDFHHRYAVEQNTYKARVSWSTVAQEFHGIIITPYLWSMRLDLAVGWYYTWDCASGCIWNGDAIASVDLLGKYVRPIESGVDA